MSWRDRPYAGDQEPQPELRIQFRKPSTAVMWLIVANVAVFFATTLLERFFPVHRLFGLRLTGIRELYLWQPITYMFMHGGVLHLVFNMIGLYIFGTEFEKAFGRDRFLQFYGTCGLVGGLAYLLLGVISPARFADIPIVGASGAVYGLLIAAVIFFPHIQVILIIFPMPIRVFGLIIGGILLLQMLSGEVTNPGGEVCHVTGALTGLAMFYAWGMMPRIRFGSGGPPNSASPWSEPETGSSRTRWREGAWARKQKKVAEEQAEVDRILAKVHEQGLPSLTRREKNILARATRRQQERDRQLGRIDRV